MSAEVVKAEDFSSIVATSSQEVNAPFELIWEQLELKVSHADRTLPVKDLRILKQEGNTYWRTMKLGDLEINERIVVDESTHTVSFYMLEDHPFLSGVVTNTLEKTDNTRTNIITYKIQWQAKNDKGKEHIEKFKGEGLYEGVRKMKVVCEMWATQMMDGDMSTGVKRDV
eukprot:GDKI01039603.1.p1 GENE.GDKI01039603.1~~GDKI01039603.1.p1  ORF type:complete len:170 (-),score=61.79 GDKI01039603.1:139-648(-)